MSAKRPLPPYSVQGVTLRPLAQDDLPLTLQWRNHDDARVWFKHSAKLSSEQHARWFDLYQAKDTDFVFIVESEGRPVGQAAVYGIDWATGSAEVGRFLSAPSARGQGHLFKACGVLVGLCREHLALRHLFLEVFATNQRAIRIYQGNGFRAVAQADGLLRMEQPLGDAP